MKKIILILTIISTIFISSNINAEIKPTNLEETIKEEIKTFENNKTYENDINTLKKVDLSNYKESSDKINIYMFRGDTCSYCLKAIVYFSSILNDYGKYFNLVTYEVWKNKDNNTLMNDVASVFNESIGGVPYIVIGDKTFTGYSSEMNKDIETQIKKVYNSKDRYDVMNNLDKRIESNTDTNNSKDKESIIINIIFQFIIAVIIIIYVNIKVSKLKEEIEVIKNAKK